MYRPNRIEQCTKKIPLTRQPLYDRLQALGIQLIYAPDNSVKKTGAFGSHYQSRHFASQKTVERMRVKMAHQNRMFGGKCKFVWLLKLLDRLSVPS